MLFGRVYLKSVIISAGKRHWHGVAMSEHGFYAPKRFTISPGLFGDEKRPKCRKFKNRFFISSIFFEVFWGPMEGKSTNNLHKHCMKTERKF